MLDIVIHFRHTMATKTTNLSPIMTPRTGDRLLRFVGDRVRFELTHGSEQRPAPGWKALLRTNLGRADLLRKEILEAHTRGLPLAGCSWRDLPMQETSQGWSIEIPAVEPGYFKAKAYLVDPQGWQHWPDGPDAGITVHPDSCRTANTIYCAFTRLHGATRFQSSTRDPGLAETLAPLDQAGFAVLPPSGTLRDLTAQLPHIVDTLGCRILQLLPINPTPTTYARFGRYGSPYAALDLEGIDPALVVFDKHTTGVDQFRELTFAAHRLGARVFLDIVINHTGWGSRLQENHPDWFLRESSGAFASPGAWGNTWEDLVELKHDRVALWDNLAAAFLTWCRRGVDGFRCDAGYKVPLNAWQYIVAKVQQEYPETIFLLEGLGGAWDATETLLTEGGMQWAYSELFQNYSGTEVAGYLEHSNNKSAQVGVLAHFSETHDNQRLAHRGRVWSLLRNRLSALTSTCGAFGFTGGVEWLAAEKINVHGCSGLAWGSQDNLVPELSILNRVLADHPCFFDGAKLTRISTGDSPIYALLRESAEGADHLLVLLNTDPDQQQNLRLTLPRLSQAPGSKQLTAAEFATWVDLLGQKAPHVEALNKTLEISLDAGAAYCLAPRLQPAGLSGDAYRKARARAAWGLDALAKTVPLEEFGAFDWPAVARSVDRSPRDFLAAVAWLKNHPRQGTVMESLQSAIATGPFPRLIEWNWQDSRRVTIVPPGFWLLLRDSVPFRATLNTKDGQPAQTRQSIPADGAYIACFPPLDAPIDATLSLERFITPPCPTHAHIRFLGAEPMPGNGLPQPTDIALLTNGRGAMARLAVDLGRIQSKYDCILGANLHPEIPVDRHVFAKRLRAWINADGFISPLDFGVLSSFRAGSTTRWEFVANAGDGRTVEVAIEAWMVPMRNTVQFSFTRPTAAHATGRQLPPNAQVSLTVRVDIEDRSFHWETQRNPGAEHHFACHCRELPLEESHTRGDHPSEPGSPVSGVANLHGFIFTPTVDRQLRVSLDHGSYYSQPEWSSGIPHPIEQSRGQPGSGDAYSPGWFEILLPKGAAACLTLDAETGPPYVEARPKQDSLPGADFGERLLQAIRAFVVRRNEGRTVIAGYPWFLDWGRDTFIAARGLLAAGWREDVHQILAVFARFEKNGTLPNSIHGNDASNRDTTDAPLWFGTLCEEAATQEEDPASIYGMPVDNEGRTLHDVLRSVATNYCSGTPNGIRMDPTSALIWSPSHFTWMDTNHPACTPREGYPIEIQALWIRLLRQLALLAAPDESQPWSSLAAQASTSLEKHFWSAKTGWYADVLRCPAGVPAASAPIDDSLRSNCLIPIAFGLCDKDRARRTVSAALRHLVVPGALRSLAPLPVNLPLPLFGSGGTALNDPANPYWGQYSGDEDTRRKPAYHNGTAWTWTFPSLCEAMAVAWDMDPEAVDAARALLGSMSTVMNEGCLGQFPEILDGDAPHAQRGCDAQAWSATEALRVWQLLNPSKTPSQKANPA